MILVGLDCPFSRVGSVVTRGHELVRNINGVKVGDELFGDFIVQSDALGPDAILSQYLI